MESNGRVSPKLAQAVKEARQHAGISQADLAIALGVSQPTISGWERAENSPSLPDVAAIEKICGYRPGGILRLAGYAPEVSISELLLTDPALSPDQRKIACDTYKMWVRMAKAQRR